MFEGLESQNWPNFSKLFKIERSVYNLGRRKLSTRFHCKPFIGFGEIIVKHDKDMFYGSRTRTRLQFSKPYFRENLEFKRRLRTKSHCYPISFFGDTIVKLDKNVF